MFPSAFPKEVIDIPGNSGTTTKLATARNINGVAFDGTKNITVPIAKTSGIYSQFDGVFNLRNNSYGNPSGDSNTLSDWATIGLYYLVEEGTTNDAVPDSGYLEIATHDNGTEPIVFKQYNHSGNKVKTLYLMDSEGNAIFPGTITAKAFVQG